ncbi:MAG: glycosyltransferase family 2 protein [Pseudobutyrivibrio ruminis]|uniref:glycosyltransferase family A protein n=1 Tax=Pseudobutyrivibrio ruminis TaxID=46206 RepID=UPI0026EF0780|nr:glycosyltransferase family A protein [Pseudobutyrivibrio ruminis]MBE5912933.1 glycosyltransferase family 2 protein [Pseudobutyrivibrio ruminis]
MPLLTVYTPTYNREKLLPRVYESLLKQTNHDFVWQVIDDGSTDGTKELVQGWMNQSPFEVRYYYKNNGGIHTARDTAYRICDTELIFGVDSDDWLVDDAVEKILRCWGEYGNEDCVGIFAKSMYEDGTLISSEFPADIHTATYQEFKYKYKIGGDLVNVFNNRYMKATLDAPVYPGEKLVGEDYKTIQLPDKPLIMLAEPLMIKEYQTDGYTADVYNCMFNNPRGFREDYRQHIIHGKFLQPLIRGYIGYISCCILIKDGTMFKNVPSRLMMILMAPVGAAGYIALQQRRKKANKSRIS